MAYQNQNYQVTFCNIRYWFIIKIRRGIRNQRRMIIDKVSFDIYESRKVYS